MVQRSRFTVVKLKSAFHKLNKRCSVTARGDLVSLLTAFWKDVMLVLKQLLRNTCMSQSHNSCLQLNIAFDAVLFLPVLIINPSDA